MASPESRRYPPPPPPQRPPDNDPETLLSYDPATVVIRAAASSTSRSHSPKTPCSGRGEASKAAALDRIEDFARSLLKYVRVGRLARGEDDRGDDGGAGVGHSHGWTKDAGTDAAEPTKSAVPAAVSPLFSERHCEPSTRAEAALEGVNFSPPVAVVSPDGLSANSLDPRVDIPASLGSGTGGGGDELPVERKKIFGEGKRDREGRGKHGCKGSSDEDMGDRRTEVIPKQEAGGGGLNCECTDGDGASGNDDDDSVVVVFEGRAATEAAPSCDAPFSQDGDKNDAVGDKTRGISSPQRGEGKRPRSCLSPYRDSAEGATRKSDAGSGTTKKLATAHEESYSVTVKRTCQYHDLGLVLSACPRSVPSSPLREDSSRYGTGAAGLPYVKSFAAKSTAARIRIAGRRIVPGRKKNLTCTGMYLVKVNGRAVTTVEDALSALAEAVSRGDATVGLEFGNRAAWGLSSAPKRESAAPASTTATPRRDCQHRQGGSSELLPTQPRYRSGQRAQAFDKGELYPIKVLEVDLDKKCGWQYYVHFVGWNSNHDRWVGEGEILPPVGADEKGDKNEGTGVVSTTRVSTSLCVDGATGDDATPAAPSVANRGRVERGGPLSESDNANNKRRKVKSG